MYPNGYGYPMNNMMMGANLEYQGGMDMNMGQM